VIAFTGAVLTGGSSSRMGTDKATLEVGGQALAVTVAGALARAGARTVVCIGGDLAALAALGLDARPDAHPGQGPLGGLVTALDLATTEVVVVLSCDLPAIDAATVTALVAALDAAPTASVAAPVIDGHTQALTAVYRRAARDHLAEAFAAGERSVRRALVGLELTRVDGLDPARLADVDRPEDLRRYAAPS
jgi:molybdenum cofactor guanylyltransferase